jgi:phosphatidylserine/phosphatidylglycerophosphate/cardiolipin synthase-like enzyme
MHRPRRCRVCELSDRPHDPAPDNCTVVIAGLCKLVGVLRRRWILTYDLPTGSGIVEALVRAKQRGVDVRLIADKTTPCRRASGIGALADVGVPIWIDDQPRIAHAKTMVIDGAVTLMGSYPTRRPAQRRTPKT